MTHPDTHSRSKAAKIHWSAKSVKNQDVFGYIKTGDRQWVAIADSGKAAVPSVNFKNCTGGDVSLWRTDAVIWEKIVHKSYLKIGYNINIFKI